MIQLQKESPGALRDGSLWTDMVCRGCGKCVRACPAGIEIPALLNMEERIHAGEDEQSVLTEGRKTMTGEPIDCIECGICSRRCPQGFDLLSIVRKYAMMQAAKL